MTDRTYRAELPEPPRAALDLLEQTTEPWGAEWQPSGEGGRLRLPVMAGLRRGTVEGPLSVEETDDGSTRLTFAVSSEQWRTDRAAVMVLWCALFGALVTLVAPFFPRLLALVPFGIVLAVAAWFFVLTKLRNSGPEEFLEAVVKDAGGEVLDREDAEGRAASAA